jgi:predicted aspartyl protease
MLDHLRFSFGYIRYPVIPVVIRSRETGRERIEPALIDTGADLSIFDATVARRLRLDLDTSRQVVLAGVGGRVAAHVLEVDLVLLGEPELTVSLPVAFVPDFAARLNNLIGRDVLEHFDFALAHSRRLGYLGRAVTSS